MKWTTDELELLHAFVEAKYTDQEIAQELERTRDSVNKKRNRLGLKSKNKQLKTHEQYVAELAESSPTMRVLEPYVNNRTSILHKCNECGNIASVRPDSKLEGKSCKFCNQRGGKIDPNKPGITYLVYFYTINLYKAGITSQTTKKRNKSQGQKYEIIFERYFELGSDAMALEEEWLINVKPYKLNTGLLKDGNSETFRYNGEI